jgi:hypothetical protein
MRAILHLTTGGDRRVVLHDVPAELATVLRILGWDGLPGLVLASARVCTAKPGVADIFPWSRSHVCRE